MPKALNNPYYHRALSSIAPIRNLENKSTKQTISRQIYRGERNQQAD